MKKSKTSKKTFDRQQLIDKIITDFNMITDCPLGTETRGKSYYFPTTFNMSGSVFFPYYQHKLCPDTFEVANSIVLWDGPIPTIACCGLRYLPPDQIYDHIKELHKTFNILIMEYKQSKIDTKLERLSHDF